MLAQSGRTSNQVSSGERHVRMCMQSALSVHRPARALSLLPPSLPPFSLPPSLACDYPAGVSLLGKCTTVLFVFLFSVDRLPLDSLVMSAGGGPGGGTQAGVERWSVRPRRDVHFNTLLPEKRKRRFFPTSLHGLAHTAEAPALCRWPLPMRSAFCDDGLLHGGGFRVGPFPPQTQTAGTGTTKFQNATPNQKVGRKADYAKTLVPELRV